MDNLTFYFTTFNPCPCKHAVSSWVRFKHIYIYIGKCISLAWRLGLVDFIVIINCVRGGEEEEYGGQGQAGDGIEDLEGYKSIHI